ncbi:MAG: hypothetical protein LH624_18745 [Cryobacterium sp.]|nr:hypothetical protein [Cryobacterium sp.]
MARDIARSKAEPNLGPTLDSVEKMLLGAAPDDFIALGAASTAAALDPRAARLDDVRKFLVDQPELRAKLGLEINKAWQRADGQRRAFLESLAERRAQVLSLAEIGRSRQQVPQATSDFDRELARYLTEMHGFGG